MKELYIKPVTDIVKAEVIEMVCATKQYTLNRYSRWGATTDQSQYGVNEWVNEGQGTGVKIGNYEAIEMGGDDNGEYYSRSNEGIWE